jgi:hypothetical protein
LFARANRASGVSAGVCAAAAKKLAANTRARTKRNDPFNFEGAAIKALRAQF